MTALFPGFERRRIRTSDATINLVIGNFSATTSVTSFDGTFLNINGGGGNLTLENRVPEPMSLTLLGVGLLGLAGLRRRKLIKR